MKIPALIVIRLLTIACAITENIPRDRPSEKNTANELQCTTFGRSELHNVHPELTNLKFVKEYEPFDCFDCNYVCKITSHTEMVNFDSAVRNDTVRLFISCASDSLSITNHQVESLRNFSNLFDLGFFNCKFDKVVEHEGMLEEIAVTRLFLKNSSALVTNVLTEYFAHNQVLDTIYLTSNNLTSLPPLLLCQWTSLVTLWLNHNEIYDLSFLYQPCSNKTQNQVPLQSLEYLDVSHNKISVVNEALFTSFPRLRRIFLNNNRIHRVVIRNEFLAKSSLAPVRKLDLSNNKLREFLACKLLPYIISLHLSNNSFQCRNDSLQLQDCHSLLFLRVNNSSRNPCYAMVTSIQSMSGIMAVTLSNNNFPKFDFSHVPRTLFNLNVVNSHVHTLTDLKNVSSELVLIEFNFTQNKLTDLNNFKFPPKLVTVNLDSNEIARINSNVFSKCSELSYISLQNNKLTDIGNLFAHLPKLVTLNLQENEILHFDYSMIPFNLLHLSLGHNKITEVTDDNHILEQIQIRFLNLSHNHFITLSKESFAPSILSLDLSNCETDSMQHDVFQNINMDQYLTLDNFTAYNAQNPYLQYGITGMVRYDYKENTARKNVDFTCDCDCKQTICEGTKPCCNSFNSFGVYYSYGYDYLSLSLGCKQVMFCLVEVSCFDLCKKMQFYDNNRYQPLKKLHCSKTIDYSSIFSERTIKNRNKHFLKQRGLMLDNMNITRLNDKAFTGFEQLVVLNLNKNLLTEIRGKEFGGLVNLTNLYLNHNQLSQISHYAFIDLHRLTFLELRCNDLKTVSKLMFIGLRHLRRLYLNDNHVNVHKEHIFTYLRNLEQLHLSKNWIYKVRRFTFAGLIKLRQLYLNSNKIHTVENFSFIDLKLLEMLNLEQNKLAVVTSSTFFGMVSLKFLNLRGNHITLIHIHSFIQLTSLHYLYLNNNWLEHWSVVLPANLTNLTLSQNKFSCDCKSVFHLKQELHAISKSVAMDADQLRCIVQNSYLPNITIKDMTDDDCYNGTMTIFHETSQQHLLVVSLCPASVLIVLLCIVSALYLYRLEVQVVLYSKFNVRLWKPDKTKDEHKTYDAFLSYSCEDRLFIAEHLLPRLEERFRVCVHERDFPVGAYIADTIADVVENTCRTIVILSPSFAQSGWCLLEFKSAHYQALKDKCCRVIVIILEEVDKSKLSSELRAYIRTNTFLQWGDPLFWEKLMYTMPHREKLARLSCSQEALVD